MIAEFNVLIAGVGGTGVLTIAHILGNAALKDGLTVVQSELHGMSQRGGSVSTHLRIGTKIHSPTFPDGTGDLLIGMEPIEALRNIKSVRSTSGTVVFNTYEIRPLSLSILKKGYPSLDLLIQQMKQFCQNVYSVDATTIAKDLGAPIVANIVLLGAAMAKGSIPIDSETVIEEIKNTVPERFVDLNVQAFQAGLEAVSKL